VCNRGIGIPDALCIWGFAVYAIIRAGGKQYRVSENDVIEVNKLSAGEGEEVVIREVLLIGGDGDVKIGAPYVEGASVVGKVTRQHKGRKIRGFTYKPKKNVSRRYGHRQLLTAVSIEKIAQAGDEPAKGTGNRE
jgi:large subunit ribosomal protein L21